MDKIGICFPENDYLKMSFDEFKLYLMMFIKEGIYSFDMYTSLFDKTDEKLYNVLSFLGENNIKITFHYHASVSGEKISLLEQYKKDLTSLRNKLQAADIYDHTTIVFHAMDYDKEWMHDDSENEVIKTFKELSSFAQTLNFTILLETLSHHHPKGPHIGDDIYELQHIIEKVDNDNFGLCWDIGHTRINHLEANDELYLPGELIKKVGFVHLHNFYQNEDKEIIMDHLPLSDIIKETDELKYLYKYKYKGIYSIEIPIENIKENIDVYLNSIRLLKQTLIKYEEEYNGKNYNGKIN